MISPNILSQTLFSQNTLHAIYPINWHVRISREDKGLGSHPKQLKHPIIRFLSFTFVHFFMTKCTMAFWRFFTVIFELWRSISSLHDANSDRGKVLDHCQGKGGQSLRLLNLISSNFFLCNKREHWSHCILCFTVLRYLSAMHVVYTSMRLEWVHISVNKPHLQIQKHVSMKKSITETFQHPYQ